MSPLQLAGGAAWKVATAVLAGVILVVGVGAGTGWWLAASDRDQARRELKAEQGVSAELRTAIGTQNAAIGLLGQQKLEAEERGTAARALAAADGQRFDAALRRMDGTRVVSCADAMPFVNQLLEDVR